MKKRIEQELFRASHDYTNFFENLLASTEQWPFIMNNIKHIRKKKIAKVKEHRKLIPDETSIAKRLNNCSARLGFYKGKEIAPKMP